MAQEVSSISRKDVVSFAVVMFSVLQRLTLTRVCVRVPPLLAIRRAMSCWWWELGGQQRELVSHWQNRALCSPHLAVNVCTSRDTRVCFYVQSCAHPCRVRAMSWDSVKSNVFGRCPKICWFLVFFESWSIFLRIQIYSFGSPHARERAGFALSNTLPSSTAGCS